MDVQSSKYHLLLIEGTHSPSIHTSQATQRWPTILKGTNATHSGDRNITLYNWYILINIFRHWNFKQNIYIYLSQIKHEQDEKVYNTPL